MSCSVVEHEKSYITLRSAQLINMLLINILWNILKTGL